MTTDEARKYLKVHCHQSFEKYIDTALAGDFAVEIAENHRRILIQLEAELKIKNDECNE